MSRPFDLVTLDLDGTLLPDTTAFEVVLRANGRGDDVAASDARFFADQQTLEATFWEQWDWVRPLSLAAMHRALRGGPWLAGIRESVGRLRDAGIDVRMLTDQPSTIADYVGRWNITRPICSPVTVHEGVQESIDFREDKWDNLRRALAADGFDPRRVCHVGNGSNDVPVWQEIGAGVAVFAEPDVAAAATVDLGRPSDLNEVVDWILAQRGGK